MFGPYEPDKPPYQTDALYDMRNAYPRSTGYSPMGQYQPITPPLPDGFQGASAFVGSDGTSALLGGTSSALYRFSGGAWTALTTGLSGNSRWDFTQFGDLVIAVNGGVTQKIDLIAGTAAPLPGNPPTATSVATVRDFVMYGGANGQQNLVQWSGFNDPTKNVPGEDQAGFQPMQSGGAVMGIAGGEYGVIVQRRRIVRASYTGNADAPFQFDPVTDEVGAVSAGSIAQSEKLVFFLSDRGFMKFDGNEVTPIGLERVDETFFAFHPRPTLGQMWSAIDPRRAVVVWVMPGINARMWLYNWQLDRWALAVLPAQAVFSGFAANTSLDALNATYPSLDAMPYSLDDPRFAGGDPLFIIVSNDNAFGTLSGPNMMSSFTIGFKEVADRRRTRLRAVVPMTDAINGLTLNINAKQRLGDGDQVKSFTTVRASGEIPVRHNGMFMAMGLDFTAGATWSYAQGLELIPAVGGGR
jgi:hypothetical protein